MLRDGTASKVPNALEGGAPVHPTLALILSGFSCAKDPALKAFLHRHQADYFGVDLPERVIPVYEPINPPQFIIKAGLPTKYTWSLMRTYTYTWEELSTLPTYFTEKWLAAFTDTVNNQLDDHDKPTIEDHVLTAPQVVKYVEHLKHCRASYELWAKTHNRR